MHSTSCQIRSLSSAAGFSYGGIRRGRSEENKGEKEIEKL